MTAFLVATFLSAFLLFQVQPIIARFILPSFGGTPAVWTTCLLFFQLALLFGYLYAHLQVRFIPDKRQPLVHCALLVISLILLPIGVEQTTEALTTNQPALEILRLLAGSIGIPFVLIAASAPLLQHWFAGAHPGRSPFRLYALSNFGSLIALLSYPVLIEPQFTLDTQANSWSILYLLLVVAFGLCGFAFWRAQPVEKAVPAEGRSAAKISVADRLLWISLAACGTTLLMAITNQMCQNIAVVPFLWILPLSLYLLSFIICFDRDAWYKRVIWWPPTAVGLVFLVQLMFEEYRSDYAPLAYLVFVFCFVLFTGCMVCHGELARRRPAVEKLTYFYLYIALGGAIGGIFVNFLAPLLFTGYWELHVALIALPVLAGICLSMDLHEKLAGKWNLALGSVWTLAVAWLAYLMVLQISQGRSEAIFVTRSFFGVLYVDEWYAGEESHERSLQHGSVSHGTQYLYPEYQHLATSYYGANSGVAIAMRNHPKRWSPDKDLNIGLIGLGTGTISALARSGDRLRYYEIDPEVEMIAREYFSYLEESNAGEADVVLGDARISLQRELEADGSQQFDVLAMDAFSGDSIPVHLLTEEAFQLYVQHLKSDGVLAIHISNQYLDLRPVVLAAAEHLGMNARMIVDPGERWYENESDWVLLSANDKFMNSGAVQRLDTGWGEARPLQRSWTDDFSNLLQIVYWRD